MGRKTDSPEQQRTLAPVEIDDCVLLVSAVGQRTYVTYGTSIAAVEAISRAVCFGNSEAIFLHIEAESRVVFNPATGSCRAIPGGSEDKTSVATYDSVSGCVVTFSKATSTLALHHPTKNRLAAREESKEALEVALSSEMALFFPPALLPANSSIVTPAQVALNLFATLEVLNRGALSEASNNSISLLPAPKDASDYEAAVRFGSQGGGWGYGGGSADAIGFSVSQEVRTIINSQLAHLLMHRCKSEVLAFMELSGVNSRP